MRKLTLIAALAMTAVIVAACSAPAQIRELQVAESQERSGDYEKALESYRSAQITCTTVSSRRRRRDSCAAAHMQYAELLVTMSRKQEAITAYREAEKELTHSPPAAAQASYSAGLLYLDLGNDTAAYEHFWRTVTDYPAEAFAADAVKQLLRHGRSVAPKELFLEFEKLRESLSGTQIDDNLLRSMADLQEKELDSPKVALFYYDRLVKLYRQSGFYDDALWHGARISRSLGDPQGAVTRLRKLLGTREVAFGAGSYFSLWLDNGQLELGIVLRDDLQDYEGAIRAFSRLPSDYPASILKDDALFERAVTKARAKRTKDACKDLAKLRKSYPDGKYELSKAPKLRSALGCSL
ncbi:MAG: tetratricopeptide repeat protein [Kofleriaceae bacterium]|nr:tetratricopeptide repeat protein [Kofleriaceae bacterium]